jgi:hypothetical protein
VDASPRRDDLQAKSAPLRVSERGTPMAAIGASPRRGQSAYGTWRRGVDIAAASAGLCTSFTWAPMAQPSRSRTTRRTFAVACALTPKAPASRTASDCFPKIEAAETTLSRLEVFEQIAARGGGTGATPERNLSTAGTPPRVQIEPVSSTPVDKLRRSLLAHQSRPNSIRSTFADSQGLRGELPSFVIDLPTLGLSHRGDSSLAVEHSAVRGRRGR